MKVPGVLAVEWLDGDTVLTCCRTCIEKDRRRAWQKTPDGFSAAIYGDTGPCDLCGFDIADTPPGWSGLRYW